MKKVCIINANIYCLFEPKSKAPMGGAELDMYMLANGIGKNFQVSVITGDWGQNDQLKNDRVVIYKSFQLNGGVLNIFKSAFILFRSLMKVNADIYISSGAGPEVGIIAIFCKLFGRRCIYRTASEIDCNKQYIRSQKLNGVLYKFGFENSNCIVTSVKEHKNIIVKNHPNLINRIVNISLGIDIDKYIDIDKPKKTSILWVGRCNHNKNPEAFLDIARKNQNYEFVMICPKVKNDEIFYALIKKEALQIKNLKFIKFVEFRKIQKYFENALLFVNTSYYEGFTYTLIQSGKAKTPVVYLNVNPDGVINKYNLGYFSNGSIKNLNNNIRRLIENHKLWNEKSNSIYDYIEANHDMNKLSTKWISLIESLV